MGKSSEAKPRSRGRPIRSQQQIEDRRAQIAACALKLFQEEGYSAISMRRLADEAGCTVMTVYQYYKRKIDILRDLWAQIFDELFDALDEIAARESDAVKRLNAIALGYVEFWLERRDRYFMVFMSSGVSQSDVSVFVQQDATLSRFAIFRDCLAAALAGAGATELTLKSQVLLCALNGISHNLITISAYPWSAPKKLVRGAVSGLLAS
jgi:AcrR family transcriptional regulator